MILDIDFELVAGMKTYETDCNISAHMYIYTEQQLEVHNRPATSVTFKTNI